MVIENYDYSMTPLTDKITFTFIPNPPQYF